MKNIKKVLLGISGGVDSSVAAILLKEQGYNVVGITMKFLNEKDNDTIYADAKKICEHLDIPHYIVDFQKEFKEYVINDFICQYKNCKTPNPCIQCNKHLKFEAMYKKAQEFECDYIATGHYAKIEYSDKYNKNVLKVSNAKEKDQSYVLYNIPSELLDKVLFPLSYFNNKDEIRQIAKKYNLPVADKPDSEDICFIPDGNYKKFLEENSDIKSLEGNIVNKNGDILGKHTGLYKYTIGQRKGLGISYKVPLFVIGFNKQNNELIVGEEQELYTKEFKVSNVNLLLDINIEEKTEVEVKTRYSTKTAEAEIIKEKDNIRVKFKQPQRAITPGQSAVFYIGDIVLGGGIIIDR